MNIKKYLFWMSIYMMMNMMKEKRAYIFDLDNTLIETKARAYLISPNGEIEGKYTTAGVRDHKRWINQKLSEGYKMNFDEIGDNSDKSLYYLMEGMRLQHFDYFEEKMRECPGDVYILTGRGNHPEVIETFFKMKWDIQIPQSHIFTVAHPDTFQSVKKYVEEKFDKHPIWSSFLVKDSPLASTHKKKRLILFHILSKGYDTVEFYDDDIDNIVEAREFMKDIEQYNFGQMEIYHV
jgi:hypothetical protein